MFGIFYFTERGRYATCNRLYTFLLYNITRTYMRYKMIVLNWISNAKFYILVLQGLHVKKPGLPVATASEISLWELTYNILHIQNMELQMCYYFTFI